MCGCVNIDFIASMFFLLPDRAADTYLGMCGLVSTAHLRAHGCEPPLRAWKVLFKQHEPVSVEKRRKGTIDMYNEGRNLAQYLRNDSMDGL